MSKMSEDEYQKQLWEFFASLGGVPKDFGMFAAQGWYIRNEAKFRKLNKLEPEDPKGVAQVLDNSPSSQSRASTS